MVKIQKKRKICFVITNFIHYSRNFLILRELNKRPDIELHVIIGGAAVVSKYTSKDVDLRKLLRDDGCNRLHELHFNLEGDGHIVKSKTTGLGIIEFSTIFNDIKPDVVVVRGDRFEVLAATVAAVYLNIPVAHIEGGDLSGTIDESVRHAITKFSHIHFVTNEDARKRVLRMGERKDYVFNFGSPDIEVVEKIKRLSHNPNKYIQKGSGARIDFSNGFIIVMYHPVANETEYLTEYTRRLLNVVHGLDRPVIWFWPNFDVGAEEISTQLRVFNDKTINHKIRFMRYLLPQDFISLLARAECFIGNSSAGIKECSYLGVPVVNIGLRQNKRLRTPNVVDVDHNEERLKRVIENQIKHGKYKSNGAYHVKNTALYIARVLATIDLYTQKTFH